MSEFVDPRSQPVPSADQPAARTTSEPAALKELHRLCREGRRYAVEKWIQGEDPIQLTEPRGGRCVPSALEIALERGDYALAFLLLCNGYDPNREETSPLDLALCARRWDFVDLLLDWGTDPLNVDIEDLFGTYRSDLFERFREMGVDMSANHGIAWTLASHTSNKPLFGFVRRHRLEDSSFQTELNIALGYHADRGNEKGVSLCLWAGADPHAPVCNLRYCDCFDENDDGYRDPGSSAIYEACSRGHVRILEILKPDPARDDFNELYRTANDGAVIAFLARSVPPGDSGAVIQSHIFRLSWGFNPWRSVEALRRLFEVGARWETRAC